MTQTGDLVKNKAVPVECGNLYAPVSVTRGPASVVCQSFAISTAGGATHL